MAGGSRAGEEQLVMRKEKSNLLIPSPHPRRRAPQTNSDGGDRGQLGTSQTKELTGCFELLCNLRSSLKLGLLEQRTQGPAWGPASRSKVSSSQGSQQRGACCLGPLSLCVELSSLLFIHRSYTDIFSAVLWSPAPLHIPTLAKTKICGSGSVPSSHRQVAL